jgi:2'-5' RNA ligase
MATELAKYFLALVPQGQIQENATALKEELKLLFNVKYALKSPAHVTIKMPFNYNELKEEILVAKLEKFFVPFGPFNLDFNGFDRFGKRVIFVNVMPCVSLNKLQEELGRFCKLELKLTNELSDRAFHPHMTLAFKDIKSKNFDTYWRHVKNKHFKTRYPVEDVALLKRVAGRWEVIYRFILKG